MNLTIVGYLIRRYFCPTEYFADPTFFDFDESEIIERKIKNEFEYLLNSNNHNPEEYIRLKEKYNNIKNRLNHREFKESDFFILRVIFSDSNASFFLALHIESLHIFLFKKIDPDKKSNSTDNEINFCRNYSHRCLTHFYGFVKKNRKITGFVYQYMCNGTLDSNISSDEIEECFQLMAVSRIWDGIKYLHSHSLIHRDIKPANILIDHDFLPYISDFNTICHPFGEEGCKDSITNDIYSLAYSSPEQYNGDNISYPTDIYSFGKMIFFLYEKRDKISNDDDGSVFTFIEYSDAEKNNADANDDEGTFSFSEHIDADANDDDVMCFYSENKSNTCDVDDNEKYISVDKNNDDEINIVNYNEQNVYYQNDKIPIETKHRYMMVPNEIRCMIDECTKDKCEERMLPKRIDFLINEEYNSESTQKLLLYNSEYHTQLTIKQFIYEAFMMHDIDTEILMNLIVTFIEPDCYLIGNKLEALCDLGDRYENGINIEQDYVKAKIFYELSAKRLNSDALNGLGRLYEHGCGVQQDYTKAIEYYIKSSSQMNFLALRQIETLYTKGIASLQDYMKAFENYELSITDDKSLAYLRLGQYYEDGHVPKQDYMKAKEFYELSAKLHNSEALNILGIYYENGIATDINYKIAKEYYEQSAKKNNPNAQFNLGKLYLNGLGVQKNYLKAIKYLELAAKQKHPSALFDLGIIYLKGLGVEANYLKAVKCFELSAEEDNSDALFHLGYMYYKGLGVNVNLPKAIEYFELSSKQNNPYSLFALGFFYDNGFEYKQDYSKALKYYEKSADQGFECALCSLGILYYYGFGVKTDYLKGKQLFELSIQQEYKDAYLYLANLYCDGFCVAKDYNKAKSYYELLEDKSDALLKLGDLYFNGYGVEKNYVEAEKYYRLSAQKNNSSALFNIGELYYNGFGVEKNLSMALKYYKLSARQANSDALLKLGNIYIKGECVMKNLSQAIEYYELSYKNHNPDALFLLGSIYSSGEFINTNIPKAIEYFKKSIEIHEDKIKFYNNVESTYFVKNIYNNYFYHSNNDLGLIYLIEYNDVEKAKKYLKEAAFAEYPYGQINYGLLNEFFLEKDINYAEYMYKRSLKNPFALAEYNLGRLKEKTNLNEAIDYYLKASMNEDTPLSFYERDHYDKRLEISRTFIICLTNLKLSHYYFNQCQFDKSKYFFDKSFQKLQINTINIKHKYFKENPKETFSFLLHHILNFPMFNLVNQPNLSSEMKNKLQLKKTDMQSQNQKIVNGNNDKKEHSKGKDIKDKLNDLFQDINDLKNPSIHLSKQKKLSFESDNLKFKNGDFKKENKIDKIDKESLDNNHDNKFSSIISKKNQNDDEKDLVFENYTKLFDFIISNEEFKSVFLDEITNIIEIMEKIIFTPPYPVLFGRIYIENKETIPQNQRIKDINDMFYAGFECSI